MKDEAASANMAIDETQDVGPIPDQGVDKSHDLVGICEVVLTTGEHVVAELYSPHQSTFMLRYPMVYQFFRNEEGQYIVFFKFMPLSDNAIIFIHVSNIIGLNPISVEYLESYRRAVDRYFEAPDDSPREHKETEKSNVIKLEDWVPPEGKNH